MTQSEDHIYYSARVAEEFERGDQATPRVAALIHYELAFHYWLLAAETEPDMPQVAAAERKKVNSRPSPVIQSILEPA